MEEEFETCGSCQGSGEGSHPNSVCFSCKGEGAFTAVKILREDGTTSAPMNEQELRDVNLQMKLVSQIDDLEIEEW